MTSRSVALLQCCLRYCLCLYVFLMALLSALPYALLSTLLSALLSAQLSVLLCVLLSARLSVLLTAAASIVISPLYALHSPKPVGGCSMRVCKWVAGWMNGRQQSN